MSGLRSCALLGVLALAHCAKAAIHTYASEHFTLTSDAYIFSGGQEGMFRSRDHGHASVLNPKQQGINDGMSFIKVSSLTFKRPEEARIMYSADEGFTGLVEVVVFEESQRSLIGYQTDEGWKYCCSEEWAKKTKCHPNKLYIATDAPITSIAKDAPPLHTPAVIGAGAAAAAPAKEQEAERELPGFPWRVEVDFMNDDKLTTLVMEDTVTIHDTGLYNMWFVICDTKLAETEARGETVWKNPRGYLPGALQPLLTFFAAMSFMHIVIALTWLVLHLCNNKGNMMAQQHLITACVTLGMIESSLDYSIAHMMNATGVRNYTALAAAVVTGALFKTCMRLTILLLAKGYGTLRPSGCDRSSVLLALGYLSVTLMRDFRLSSTDFDDVAVPMPSYVAPVAIAEAILVWCTMMALRGTMQQLAAKGSSVRTKMFVVYSVTYGVLLAICALYLTFEAHIRSQAASYLLWRFDWMHTTFWHVFHIVTVAILCILWAPGELAACYIYHELHMEDEKLLSAKPPAPSGVPRTPQGTGKSQ